MKKIKIYALLALLVSAAASCKKPNDFGQTNVNPAATTVPIASALFTGVESTIGGSASVGPGSQYAQYVSETQYPGVSLYVNPQFEFSGNYNGNLYDLQTVINLNVSKNSVATAKILQQYIYRLLTDLWGDIPYSQALQGIKNISPAYDTQENIYKGMLTTLASAVASMDGGKVDGDLFYGGDPAGWKRMANSLRMLIAIQLSAKVPGAGDYAATAFKAAMTDAGGYIQTNDQNFTQPYNSTFKNPNYLLYDGRTDYGESKTLTDITAAFNDGRTVPFGGSFLDPGQVTGGTQTSNIGVPYGGDRNSVTAFTAANPAYALVLRADKRTTSSPVVVIGAAEVNLAIAEAINIGWVTGDLNATYQNGINLSFAQWGVAAPAAGYFTNANVKLTAPDGAVAANYGSANDKAIATQQWLAAYPDGHMGWNIWRKTGWPNLTPAPGHQNTSGQIVRRYTYGTSEFATNPTGVNPAVGRETGHDPGKDSQDNWVFWDVGNNAGGKVVYP